MIELIRVPVALGVPVVVPPPPPNTHAPLTTAPTHYFPYPPSRGARGDACGDVCGDVCGGARAGTGGTEGRSHRVRWPCARETAGGGGMSE